MNSGLLLDAYFGYQKTEVWIQSKLLDGFESISRCQCFAVWEEMSDKLWYSPVRIDNQIFGTGISTQHLISLKERGPQPNC